VAGVIIDITDRHRIEDALRASEARLKLAQKAANTGVWEWDPATRRASWSPEVYRLLGLDPVADATDPHAAWLSVLHPEDRDHVDTTVPRAMRDGEGFTLDFRIIRRDTGELRWIRSHGTVIADDVGQPMRVVGVNFDVTDAHRQQQALEERNRALQQSAELSLRERERVFELSQDLFAAVGFDGFLKVINPAWSRLLGYDDATLLGRPLATLVHPDDLDDGTRVGLAMLQGELRHRFENRLRCADGSWRRFAWVVVCEGPMIYAVGRDVTEETRVAEALEMANRQLRNQIQERERVEDTLRQVQRLEAVGQLTAGVSHDFNNLLTVILGNIDFVERAIRDPKLQQRLGFMRQAALRGATLTAQLLAFSRRQRLEPKPVDLNSTVERMSDLLKSTLGGGVRLSTVLKPEPWSALVDPTQMELVILNLAINARDAMPAGGNLTIEASNVTLTAPPQQPGEPAPGDYVMVCVADSGTGMDEAVRARAFEPFFTTKDVGKGSGLGLAQVLGFAQQSGGGVRIDSRPGEGTAVCVYLPRVVSEADADQASLFAEPWTPAASACLALVVDDDRDVREVTAAKLRDLGFRVIDTGTGVAALDLLERNPDVGLLVADFAMPGMNGAEVARRARTLRPGLPVIFVTGYADQSALAEVADAAVVQKPFRNDELESKIAALSLHAGASRTGAR
jgi:PAS domain S-box-containing protein